MKIKTIKKPILIHFSNVNAILLVNYSILELINFTFWVIMVEITEWLHFVNIKYSNDY